jgi:hypothetical protein
VAVARQSAAGAAQRFAPGIGGGGGGPQQEEEEEFRGFRGSGRRRPRRPADGRSFRPRPRYSYAAPVYPGWAPYPPPAYPDDARPAEPDWGDSGSAGPAGGGGDQELASAYAGSNGFAAGARNGRWVKRGRVLIVYGA